MFSETVKKYLIPWNVNCTQIHVEQHDNFVADGKLTIYMASKNHRITKVKC